MKRKNMPQLMNQSWFPSLLKTHVHEFMTWFVHQIKAAKPFLPVVEEGLQYSDRLIALEVEVGAGFETLKPFLAPDLEILSDSLLRPGLEEKGLYMSVNAFHQLSPDQASQLLSDIVASKNPVVIVEGNNDSLWQVFGMSVIVPLTVILTAPFVKPFRWTRLLFTYLLPILPLVTFLDGFLALFKLYAPADLDELTGSIPSPSYEWRSGKLDNGRGGKIIYLIGHPVPVSSATLLTQDHVKEPSTI